jgi:hypothetical protein
MRRAAPAAGWSRIRGRARSSTRGRRLCAAVLTLAAVALGPAAPLHAAGTESVGAAGSTTPADSSACRNGQDGERPTGEAHPTCQVPREGILLSPAELMALPTSGPGWDAIMARIEQPYGDPYRLATRDDANKDVLAHALAGARLDDDEYRGVVRDALADVMAAPRDTEDVLGTLRHLQTYIISADLIDLASFDPDLDATFREWLADEIRFDYSGGGGGGSVISTHEKKPNNFGTHAGATRLAAALYLGDEEEFQAARDIWYGWATGDPDHTPSKRAWTGTDWQCDQDRPAGINPAGCSRDGHRLDGVIPEDQERCGPFSWPPCETNYIHGAADGMLLSFWMMARQGENPWAWGDRAALRQMEWKYEVGQPPYEGFRWQIPVVESVYGVDLAGNDPTATSTNFGYADWWAPAYAGPVPRIEGSGPGDVGGDRGAGVLPWIMIAALVLAVGAGLLLTIGRRHRMHRQ